ncbi:MAG TPA: error-prone DNA polymerase, partial [Inquilinus sp.]
MSYAELQVTTNFSFLRGASHAHELAGQAAELRHGAIAVTDRNTLGGAVRLHQAAKQAGLRPVIGARLDFTDAPSVLVYPTDRAAYGRLSRMLTTGKRRTTKGECSLQLADLLENAEGLLAIALQPDGRLTRAAGEQQMQYLGLLRATFGDRLYLGVQNLLRGDDARRLAWAIDAGARLDIPLVATNDVHAHARSRRALQDVMTCIRERATLRAVGRRLHANGERYLKDEAAMRELFAACPEAVDRTAEIVERCRFDLDALRYEYPIDTIPADRTAQQHLVQLTWEGAARMYPDGVPDKVRGILEHELTLVDQLAYAPYFLTVHDIVSYARGEGILCQGRGSAANSAICYVLGITAVDPARSDMLFERFISPERKEPPDIDVDFENERREEVYQYIYRRYGRERAGLAATVITYRSKSAIRDVGKALGLSSDTIDRLARSAPGWDHDMTAARLRDAGIDPRDRTARRVLALAGQLYGFPRHLSQHVGGFVITRGRLDESVPIENAAMEDRTCIEWDKDDLDALGMLKIDILALGMLTCVRKAFEFLEARTGHPFRWHDVPPEDPAVYDMLCQADSVGVFQVESRAQMSMLPRLKPRCFYDLVIEVAIVRPGPIQGDMVHPYLRRRQNKEPVAFPKEELRRVLGKTLGVPLFQEQAMAIAITAAGFSPGEADQLRRSMSAYRRTGRVAEYRDRMVNGMVARGYDQAFAEHCFSQIEGFGEYGFPESHAASFALIVYVSAWLKKHHPAIFCAAILNSQPMGFYAPAQLVRDAREHGVEVRPVDVNNSDWDCSLETGPRGLAVRLGMRQVKGMREVDAARIAAARGDGYN